MDAEQLRFFQDGEVVADGVGINAAKRWLQKFDTTGPVELLCRGLESTKPRLQ